MRQLLIGIPYWLGLPVLVTLAGYLPGGLAGPSTLPMLYLIGLLICSLKTNPFGLMASALLSFFLFSYFHTEPRYSLVMHDLNELVSGMLFVVFAMLAGNVAYRLRTQLQDLEHQGDFLRRQVMLGQKLQHVTREEEILPLLDTVSRESFSGSVEFRLLPPGTPQNPAPAWHLTWVLRDPSALDEDKQAMLLSIKEQVHAVLDKLSVWRALQQAERKSDEERLRSALLSSISHDLKRPLHTLMEAARSLRGAEQQSGGGQTQALLDTILADSHRLESYVQNLLEMTRLGQGKLPLSRATLTYPELHKAVVERLSRQWPGHAIKLDCEDNLPPLHVHPTLIEQALCNALDNALKAGGPEKEVLVDVRQANETVAIRICDKGPGLPESEWEAAFEQFNTFSGSGYEKGTGLGLSICRSIFRVHGGDAVIIPPPKDFGHCLLLTLPVEGEKNLWAE